ncbi:MAG TPA: hypothetical protein VFA27_10750 [Vicinamibacterales bacterium]|nr:hypothetical protein [Vicinamibacterales bacterium]
MSRVLVVAALLLLVGARSAHADATVTLCVSDTQSGAGTNLTSALAAGGRITFNCGAAATIHVNCRHSLSANTVIDGGGAITLQASPASPGCGGLASAFTLFENPSPARRSLHLQRLRIVGIKPIPDGGVTTLTGGNVARGNLDVTLADVTITASYQPILLDEGSVVVERSELSNNDRQAIVAPEITVRDHSHLLGNGGSPLESRGGKVTIADSDFTGNKQVSDLTNCTSIDIRNSRFTNNVGAFQGGALRTNCSAQIWSSTFAGNQAKSGGALHVGDLAAHTMLADVEFTGNVATGEGDGGAIAFAFEVLGPSHPPLAVELHHVTFKSNRAGIGGALSFGRGDVTGAVLSPRILTGAAVQFIDNQAGLFAGALFTSRAVVRLTDSLFMGNRGGNAGGAIVGLQAGDGSLELSNSLLVKNVAPVGAAFAGNGVRFVNATFADNGGPAVSALESMVLQIAKVPIGPQPVRFQNTIVSTGGANPCGPANPAGPYEDQGNNLQYPANSCVASIAVGAPQFGPSYIPLPSSPAANAGNDAVCAASPVAGRDIWGRTRPKGAHCTIGAAESDIWNIVEQALAPVTNLVSSLFRCFCGDR